MLLSSEIGELPYLDCPHSSHSEQLSLVCLEQTCSSNILICPLCEAENHHNHPTMPLKVFLQQHLTKSNSTQEDQLLMQRLCELQQIKQNIKSTLTHAKQSFLEALYSLESMVSQHFNNLSEKILKISKLRKGEELQRKIINLVRGRHTAQFKNLLRMMKINNNGLSKDASLYYVNSARSKFSSLKQKIATLKIQSELTQICKTFALVKDPYMRPEYRWSEFKGSKILVKGLVATQSMSSSNGQRFALIESQGGLSSDISLMLKIRNLSGWIGIGICLKNSIVKAGYKFNYTVNYHGSYLISTNGYSWSHSQPEFNAATKSFSFHSGDVIKIEYFSNKKQVVYTNTKNSIVFRLQVVEPPSNDQYVACVNLCNPGDEVEIINDIQ